MAPDIELWQMLLIIFYGFFINYEKNSTMFGTYQPVVAGFIVGIIMGDVTTGLFVGGTLQLMALGISNFGGASVPDYQTASVVATFITISTGQKPELGIAIGIPVALFMVQLDILRMTFGVWLQNQAEKFAENGQYKKIEWMQYIGLFVTAATTGIPILIAVVFGPSVVDTILNYTPDWLMGGLKVAGGLLPAVGIALLLRYLPTKENFSYLLIGFLLVGYLKLPILGVALFGAAIALLTYKRSITAAKTQVPAGGFDEDE
ncbi:PTS mannose/fructose/sorbose/N-acetylgalactosamine transporter subunit IIC [Neobacillus sp. 19]|uniref:PTS mannose/fructose/sorbose/N-acetylgalactosamine transporter subunit IIC n=1 Tax=Neobacillus sp. 19 TaxID=3394458 RepID=UPI003BF670BC